MAKSKFIPGGSRPLDIKAQWEADAIVSGSKTQHRFPLLRAQSVIDGLFCSLTTSLWLTLDFSTAAVTYVSGPNGFEPIMSVAKKSGDRMHAVSPVFTKGSTLWAREPAWKDDDGVMHYKYAGATADTREASGFPFVAAHSMREDDTRMILEIINVSTERLQEITALEISREGCVDREDFAKKWNKGRRKRGIDRTWKANPWVHVITFEIMALR